MSEDDLRTLPTALLDERYAELRLPQPGMERAMASSMRRYGQIAPVVGCERGPAIALVDGFKRLHAARQIDLEALVVKVLPLTERAAVAALYGMNRQSHGLADIEEAWVVRALVRTQGMTQPEVGTLLGRHKSWVSRRLALVERLDEQVQQDIRVGLVPVTVGRDLLRLPRGNQVEVAAAIHRNGLTTREATTLVDLFEATVGREAGKELLAHPREAIAARRAKQGPRPPDPRLGPAVDRAHRSAVGVAEGLTRLVRQLQEVFVARCTATEREVLGRALRLVARVGEPALSTAADVAAAMEVSDGS